MILEYKYCNCRVVSVSISCEVRLFFRPDERTRPSVPLKRNFPKQNDFSLEKISYSRPRASLCPWPPPSGSQEAGLVVGSGLHSAGMTLCWPHRWGWQWWGGKRGGAAMLPSLGETGKLFTFDPN